MLLVPALWSLLTASAERLAALIAEARARIALRRAAGFARQAYTQVRAAD